jgi:hypothetical protein
MIKEMVLAEEGFAFWADIEIKRIEKELKANSKATLVSMSWPDLRPLAFNLVFMKEKEFSVWSDNTGISNSFIEEGVISSKNGMYILMRGKSPDFKGTFSKRIK